MGLLAYSVLIKKMEHIPGWGSSPWSQAPTDNTFRLVQYISTGSNTWDQQHRHHLLLPGCLLYHGTCDSGSRSWDSCIPHPKAKTAAHQ